ncbi:MAG: glycosyltransferase family 1 protein [Beijerinckiaceae bacterium]|nr:MAG: glycosyltransferase family 1 protein [Beijerinckiaceae bacterium]
MKFVLIANGLTNHGEHSYRLVHEVLGALNRRGIEGRAYAAMSLDPAIVGEGIAIPHFKHSLYDHIGTPPLTGFSAQIEQWRNGGSILSRPDEYLTWRFLNRSFCRDLNTLPADDTSSNRLLVITAICQNQISGLADFMRSRPRGSLPNVVCQLMFPPHWTPWETPAKYADRYYREALQKAAPLIGDKLFFTTENEPIAQIYLERYGIETKILPVPFARTRPPRLSQKTVRLGFFGYSKSEKGFHLLPDVADLCRSAGLDVEFDIQIQHSRWEPVTIAAEEKLRGMPNVRLIEGALNSDDYTAATDRADVILLPYDPVLFGMRGSGLFTESVAAGRPIIASSGTFAGESILRGEAQGETFRPHDAQQLFAAIERILPRLPEIVARAQAQAESFARRHDGDAYVDALLGLFNGAYGHPQEMENERR